MRRLQFETPPRVVTGRLRFAGLIVSIGLLVWSPAYTAADLPSKLSDRDFWQLIEDFSEPGGVFPSDNLVSNERPFQNVVPALRELKRDGVYLGVAPDQNFTYIAALDPKVAFIIDIRRGNLHSHLMYKALFELSPDRADFVSRLFSRMRPEGLGPEVSPRELFDAYAEVSAGSETLFRQNLTALQDWLTKRHTFLLPTDDLAGVEYVYRQFYSFGPGITYLSTASRGRSSGPAYPSYADLQKSVDLTGRHQSYLATEELFRRVKRLQDRNLIVPIVGDFAGPKALRSVGKYLADRGAVVTAFYTSNVEQYLFQNGVWRSFYQNVAALPLDDASVFVRSVRTETVLDPIKLLLKDVEDGKIQSYADVTARRQ